MGFNIIEASKTICEKYKRYLHTIFSINDKEYQEIFEKRLGEIDNLCKGPYLDVTNSFKKGRSVKQLISDGVLSKDFSKIKRLYDIPSLYLHQEEALLKIGSGENVVVSTGTGSGKTECFLIPLINELMKEKENGTLDDGVRALIIYPMNALANDQIDRLRKLFLDYPDITFGCYTGQTREKEESKGKVKGAKELYKDLNGKRVDEPRLRDPLPNERLSRESMKRRPPHILISNYAMMEYLLLRPNDNVFFDGPMARKWKYIILDEAHTYAGSTGAEVSMLIRRLKARLENPSLQFILTSATLGDESKNNEIINFASSLCSASFKPSNIVRGTREEITPPEAKYELEPAFYKWVYSLIDEGKDDKTIIKNIEDRYSFNINEDSLDEYLYELLLLDKTFWRIKLYMESPKSVTQLCSYSGFDEEEVSAFVEVASRANKNQSKLFDSRYHLFIRATEGVFITLPPHKDLFLKRKETEIYNGKSYRVFEAVTCSQCHSLYLLGRIGENSTLVQDSMVDPDQIKEAFYIGDRANDTDEDSSFESSKLIKGVYELCPECGFIRKTTLVHKQCCEHDESNYIKLIRVKTKDDKDGRVTKCINCEYSNRLGVLRSFFTGQEATTSVIGTALFEELPSHCKRIIIHDESEADGFDFEQKEDVEIVNKAKQFIAFSDSRQAAAYFSSYFSVTYDQMLYGRMMEEVLKSIPGNDVELPLFAKNLAKLMEDRGIIPFDDYLEIEKKHSINSFNYLRVAYQAILNELVSSNSRNSLIGLGLLGLDFNKNIKFSGHKKAGLNPTQVKDICLCFTFGMLSDAAIFYPEQMNQNQKEFFTHNGIELSYLENDSDKYIRSFIPVKSGLSNKRLDYLARVMKSLSKDMDRDEIKNLLDQFWMAFFAPNSQGRPQILFKDSKGHYKVNSDNLVISKDNKWYKCSKCKKLTQVNVNGVCPSYHCDGHLEEVDIDTLERDNHYYRLYNDLNIEPLRVVEHTAQLNREEAYNYQTLFKEQKIDVLSCSTTFEMGVDVGDLETVFMRNMPPSPSNYAQRAGRAGRSSSSSAFALTFCNKSNHDFHFFSNPISMIKGVVDPPHFKVDNEKICIRHLYSSAFSFFFRIHPEYFGKVSTFMDADEENQTTGYDCFKQFLQTPSFERDELNRYLHECIPPTLWDEFELDDFGWVKYLFMPKTKDYPSLFDARNSYESELSILRDSLNKSMQDTSSKTLPFVFEKRINTYIEEPIISFLSRNNVLPKYGFPVDTVSLEINPKTNDNGLIGLDLSRDLSMAISEYAPGCQVVADGKLLTSRYIKTVPDRDLRKYDYVICKHCHSINTVVNVGAIDLENTNLKRCTQCGSELDLRNIGTFLIPEFGFIAEDNIAKPTLVKPEKSYKTEASYCANSCRIKDSHYKIGKHKVSIGFVGRDGEMAVMNHDSFYVCPSCGYTINGDGHYGNSIEVEHKNTNGYTCSCKKLVEYNIGYKYKTDIIRLRFDLNPLSFEGEKETYSILQSLILASSRVLNIENTEIAGCLLYTPECDGEYTYILYDTTPGGAGHVKRLNDQDIIERVIYTAYHIAFDCTGCDEDSSCYSCLRTYQNQKHHDEIKRSYVINFLGKVLGVKD